jgi:F0F1-type ATP synthase assembly protein I
MENPKHIKNFKTAKILVASGNLIGALFFFIAYYFDKQLWFLIVGTVLIVSIVFEVLLINNIEKKLFANKDSTIS